MPSAVSWAITAIRSLLFILVAWPYSFSLAFVMLPALCLPRRYFMWVVQFWAASVLWLAAVITGIRHRVEGDPHPPGGPFVYAVKHQSAWETIALNLILPGAAFVLKRELLNIFPFGLYLRAAGNIAIRRRGGARVLAGMIDDARGILARGSSLIIFPEGTRTPPGQGAGAYHPGVAALYAGLEVPVVPVALNAGLFWPRQAFLRRPGTVTVSFLPPIPPGLPRREFISVLRDRIQTETDRLEAEAAPHA